MSERDLRAMLAEVIESPPAWTTSVNEALVSARRARRRRLGVAVSSVGAVAAAVLVAGVVVVADQPGRRSLPASGDHGRLVTEEDFERAANPTLDRERAEQDWQMIVEVVAKELGLKDVEQGAAVVRPAGGFGVLFGPVEGGPDAWLLEGNYRGVDEATTTSFSLSVGGSWGMQQPGLDTCEELGVRRGPFGRGGSCTTHGGVLGWSGQVDPNEPSGAALLIGSDAVSLTIDRGDAPGSRDETRALVFKVNELLYWYDAGRDEVRTVESPSVVDQPVPSVTPSPNGSPDTTGSSPTPTPTSSPTQGDDPASQDPTEVVSSQWSALEDDVLRKLGATQLGDENRSVFGDPDGTWRVESESSVAIAGKPYELTIAVGTLAQVLTPGLLPEGALVPGDADAVGLMFDESIVGTASHDASGSRWLMSGRRGAEIQIRIVLSTPRTGEVLPVAEIQLVNAAVNLHDDVLALVD